MCGPIYALLLIHVEYLLIRPIELEKVPMTL